MGDCSCEGLENCKTYNMHNFGRKIVEVYSKNDDPKELEAELKKLGIKKYGNTYIMKV